jgi:RNA polymerase sigma factor (sigma-70 family)
MIQPRPSPATHESAFIERYQQLYKWALILTKRDEQQAEDLLHDAFVQFSLSRPELESIQNLDGYLYRILRNLRVSQMRRVARIQEASLNMAGSSLENILSLSDHSSLESGLISVEQRAQQQLQDELRRICQYAVARKASSKAGSVLLLRFFLGYYPEEIAQVLKSSRAVVDKTLQRARGEARLFLTQPDSFRLLRGNANSETLGTVEPGKTLSEFLHNLRAAIYNAEQSACLTAETIRGLYTVKSGVRSAALDTKALGHVVSCPRCLDEINRILGLPLLAARHPAEMGRRYQHKRGQGPKGGRDGGGSAGSSSGAATGESFLDRSRKRLKEACEHLPQELRICVNGFQLGSQRVSAELNQQTLSVKGEDKVGFVEVFSEREVRLLFYCVESPPDGPVEHHQRIDLSSGRSLELSLDFSAESPSLEVLYRDPALAVEPVVDAEDAFTADSTSDELRESKPLLLPDLKPGPAALWKRFLDWKFLLRPAPVTAFIALMLVAALIIGRFGSFKTVNPGAEILQRAALAEGAIESRAGQALHRTINLDEKKPTGELLARRRVEVWQSADRGITARRIYDDNGKLLAGDWRRSDGVQTLYHHGIQPKLQLAPERGVSTALGFDNVWELSLSTKEFSSLVGNAKDVHVEERPTSYVLTFSASTAETSARTAVERAELTLNRADLHPIEQTLTIRQGDETREYRFMEANFEQKALSTVAPSVFEPDPELLSSTKPNAGNPKAETVTAPGPQPLTPVVATAELEVDVLGLLHQAGADLGEQVTVTRTSEGQLLVEALVDTDQRKAQLLHALESVRGNPAVRIKVNTVAEVLSRQSVSKSTPESIIVERHEAGNRSLTTDSDLRRYFSAKGLSPEQVDQEVMRFANRAVNQSLQVLVHAGAIKRLAERFSAEQLGALTPEARAKWLAIVRAHAQSVRQETTVLRQELQPVFPAAVSSSSEEQMEIGNDADLLRAIERLFEICAANDRMVSSAFTIKASGPNISDLQGPQFWRSLRRAEQLAARIASSQ